MNEPQNKEFWKSCEDSDDAESLDKHVKMVCFQEKKNY